MKNINTGAEHRAERENLRGGQVRSAAAKPTVLAVSGDADRLRLLDGAFAGEYSVQMASGGRNAIQILQHSGPVDVLVFDEHLPDGEGLLLMRYIQDMMDQPDRIIKIQIADSDRDGGEFSGSWIGRIDARFDEPFDAAGLKKLAGALMAQKSKEKRQVMRAEFYGTEPSVDIGGGGTARVANLSETGMFIRTNLPQDCLLPFKIFLPDRSPLLASGRVVRVDDESGGVGIKFLLLEDESREVLFGFLSDRVMNDSLPDLKEKYPFLQVDRIVPFTNREMILSWLEEARRSRTDITAIHADQRTPVRLRLEAFEPWRFCRLVGADLNVKFKTSDSLFVSFQSGNATYNFETVVYRIGADGVSLECFFPRIVFYSEKRAFKRTASDGFLKAEVFLPEPFNGVIQGTITDISEGGVSFVTQDASFALLAGTPLEAIRIIHEERLVREVRGEVRNIRRIDSDRSGGLRYGVQFGIGRLTVFASRMSGGDDSADRPKTQTTERFRSGPRKPSDLSPLAKRPPRVVRLENAAGEEIVGLLDSSFPLDEVRVPVIVIPPAFGKTKETLFALAETIVENFYAQGKPVAVFRFDGIRRKGESHKDAEASEPPFEMINASLSQGGEDIKAVLDWIEANSVLRASSVILVTFSLAALEARIVLRDDRYRRKIQYWISCMGTPELRHLLTRVNCGLDLLEQHQLGIKLGVLPVLGNQVNVDRYMEDGVRHGIATLDQAREDMKRIDIPITWIYGEHDHWVRPDFIRDVMGVFVEAPREVMPMPLGHNARTSDEALHMFGTITSLVHRFLTKDSIRVFIPARDNLEFKRHTEKDRIPARTLKNRQDYWRRYLVGDNGKIGFDVLSLADDYAQLMGDQLEALDLGPDDRFLDLGGGTGNFVRFLLESRRPLPRQITIADLVPEAIAQATAKLRPRFAALGGATDFNAMACDVEMNRYLPVHRYIRGEVSSFVELVDRIENLNVQSAARIAEKYSPRLHRILRGEEMTAARIDWLKQTFELQEIRTILDFNLAARYVQGLEHQPPAYRHLSFPGVRNGNLTLPIKPGSYDKILMSLVLSYIFNPLESLIQVRRILAPGGLLVLSSLHPDADASGLFTRLVEKVERMDAADLPACWDKPLVLASIRSFLNDAQALVELEEAGTFDFFDQDKLFGLLEEAGFQIVRTIETFGRPPQGYVCLAKAG